MKLLVMIYIIFDKLKASLYHLHFYLKIIMPDGVRLMLKGPLIFMIQICSFRVPTLPEGSHSRFFQVIFQVVFCRFPGFHPSVSWPEPPFSRFIIKKCGFSRFSQVSRIFQVSGDPVIQHVVRLSLNSDHVNFYLNRSTFRGAASPLKNPCHTRYKHFLEKLKIVRIRCLFFLIW